LSDKRSVLITGGLGYLGGRLSRHLADTGKYNIVCGTSRKDAVVPDALAACDIEFLDLQSPGKLNTSLRGMDTVIHLASLNAVQCAEDPMLALKVNVGGTINLLSACESGGVRRVIYMSTAHVYGSPLQGDIAETTCPEPLHHYAITHKSAEDYIYLAHVKNKISGVRLRLSNVVGSPVDVNVNCWHLLTNDISRQLVTTGNAMLHSDGRALVDFVSMQSILNTITELVEIPNEVLGDGLFNLGSGSSVNVLEMANKIIEIYNTAYNKTAILYVPDAPRSNTRYSLNYNCNKLRGTGIEISKTVDDDINDLLKFCVHNFSGD